MASFRGIALLVAFSALSPVWPGDFDGDALADWVSSQRRPIVEELSKFIELPNVAANREDMRRNAEHLRGMLSKRGLDTRLLDVEGMPYVVASLSPEASHPGGNPPSPRGRD